MFWYKQISPPYSECFLMFTPAKCTAKKILENLCEAERLIHPYYFFLCLEFLCEQIKYSSIRAHGS